MQLEQIIELCKWDYLSYDGAIAASPYKRDRVLYEKQKARNIRTGPSKEVWQIRIQNEPFGLYSWMPDHSGDRAAVLEHKTEINLRSSYVPENEKLVEFVCSWLKEYFRQTFQLAVGICCVGRMDSEYVMAVAKTKFVAAQIVIFGVSPVELQLLKFPSQLACDYLADIAERNLIAYERAF